MHKGFDSTLDSQTPIVTGHPDPAYALSAGKQGAGGVFGSGRDSQDTFAVVTFGEDVARTLSARHDSSPCADRGMDVVAFHPTQDPISTADGSTHSMGCGSKQGCCTQAVAFKPSHYTHGKDGKPSEVAAPPSADACKGDQDTVIAYNTWGGEPRADRPKGGFYVEENAETSKTLDSQGGLNPSASQGGTVVAFTKAKRAQSSTDDESWVPGEVAPTQNQFDVGDTRATTVVAAPKTMQVRRLTPTECERLQGFPDHYTDVTYRKKPAADGPRYKALGNSMAVPCMAWIGYRIEKATRGNI